MTPAADALSAVDPFDLPDWLGTHEVEWAAGSALRASWRVTGLLSSPDREADPLPCDLLAVDRAYPSPVVPDPVRTGAHQAWQHGQVALLDDAGRLVLAVPGRGFDAERALDAVARLALALGAVPDQWSVRLRLGRDHG